jgi:hypothetical protein
LATIIDSLIVTLGLDASKYKQGTQQATAATAETARKTKLAAEQITKSLAEVGRTVAALFLGFETVSGFGKFLAGLNEGEASLGRTAKTLDMNVHELNKWGNAVKLVTGNASDAFQAFDKITQEKAAKDLRGEVGPMLQMLQQFGVAFENANGKLRNQGDILEELADKTAWMGAAQQKALFASVGLTEGEINYLVQAKSLRQEQLRLAEKNNNVTDESVAKAQALQEYWRNIGIQIESAGQSILQALTPAVEAVFETVSNLVQLFKDTGGLDVIAQTFRAVWNIVKAIGDSIRIWSNIIADSPIGKYFNFMFKLYGKGLDLIAPPSEPSPVTPGSGAPQVTPETLYQNNNPGNIKAVGNQPRDARGFRVFANADEGKAEIAAWIARRENEGLRTIAQLVNAYEGHDAPGNHNDIPAYIQALERATGKRADDSLDPSDTANIVRGIITHEGAQVPSGATPGLVGGGGSVSGIIDRSGGGGTTTVTIGKIDVRSNASDPVAVANQTADAIQRKLTAAQAYSGQN